MVADGVAPTRPHQIEDAHCVPEVAAKYANRNHPSPGMPPPDAPGVPEAELAWKATRMFPGDGVSGSVGVHEDVPVAAGLT